MKVYLNQFYLDSRISFPFGGRFQKYMHERLSALTPDSTEFARAFGPDFDLMFRLSARAGLEATEVRGPTAYRRDKSVEFTLFLPYDVIVGSADPKRDALRRALAAVYSVYDRLGIDSTLLRAAEADLVETVVTHPDMAED